MSQTGALMSLVAGAALLSVCMRASLPPATWVALTLLVHASRLLPPSMAFPSLWVALFAATSVGRWGILPAGGPGYFVTVALISTALTFIFGVDRIASTRLSGVTATLVFPAAWVAAEFLQSRSSPAATWGSIAYTQFGYLPLMQVSAVVGIWGISFLVAWFASTLDYAWTRGFEWHAVRGPALSCAAVFLVLIVGGAVRLAMAPTDGAVVRVATLNRPRDLFVPGEMTRITEASFSPAEREPLGQKLRTLHDWFLDGSRREARAGARVVVWPEGNLLVFKEDEATFLERARQLAASEQIYLAMGMGTIHSGEALPFENKLVLIDPTGTTRMSYLKSHAVPGWEAGIMRRGDGRVPVVSTDAGRMAGMVCFDADFPEFVRQAAQADADVLLLPVNDWLAVKDIHFHMAAFRAIENGLPLVRAAASGLSVAVDPYGRVLGSSDYFAKGDGTMTAQVPIGRVPTPYAKTGDWFAWSCVAAVAALLVLSATSYVPGR
jgi:apolipoprotein N-acyltransferase